jgi:hypothetical protein
MVHDSLTGVSQRLGRAIPLDHVAYVSVRKANVAMTLLLAGGTVSTGLIALLAATWNQ